MISGRSAASDAPRRPQSGHPAFAGTLLILSLSAYVAFAVLFYTPISPATFYANGNNLAALWTVPIAAFSVIGWLIAVRKPGNPIGWICLAGGTVGGIASLADEIGSLLDQAHSAAGHWVLLLSASTGNVAPSFSGLIVIALLLFPDGHLPSPRWRWVVGAIAAVSTFGFALNLLDPTPGNIGESTHDVSALAIRGAAPTITTLGTFTSLATLGLGATVVVSIFLRLRGADADRRHQIKLVAFASLLPVIVITGLSLLPVPSAGPGAVINAMAAGLTALAILAVPTAIGIAVLKYRLYDIDVIISRTLVYGALAALITAVYIGIAVGIGTLVGSGGQPNLWLSIVATIIVAVGFQPVRERLQRIANRLVYGKRATPYEVLSEFSGQVAETYAADEVLPRMARVLQEGTGAESSTVWLRSGSLLRPTATFPESASRLDPVPMTDGGLPEMPGVTTSALVEHQGRVLGALSIVKRRGESLTPTEAKLLDDLAHQAGLVLRNVSLASELQQRLNELRASRQRLCACPGRGAPPSRTQPARRRSAAPGSPQGQARAGADAHGNKAGHGESHGDPVESGCRRGARDTARPCARNLSAASRRQRPGGCAGVAGAQSDGPRHHRCGGRGALRARRGGDGVLLRARSVAERPEIRGSIERRCPSPR